MLQLVEGGPRAADGPLVRSSVGANHGNQSVVTEDGNGILEWWKNGAFLVTNPREMAALNGATVRNNRWLFSGAAAAGFAFIRRQDHRDAFSGSPANRLVFSGRFINDPFGNVVRRRASLRVFIEEFVDRPTKPNQIRVGVRPQPRSLTFR